MRKGWQRSVRRCAWFCGLCGCWLVWMLAVPAEAVQQGPPDRLVHLVHAGEGPPKGGDPAPARHLDDPRHVSLGLSADPVWLWLALADRINHLQRERRTLLDEQRRLHSMSYLDGLTGVHNRCYLDEALLGAVIEAETSGTPLTLIMLDLDNFKRFNDGWGHAEGDRALQHLAWVIDRVIRDIDPVCRYGGEEFVILLRERDEIQAREIAERIREELAVTPMRLQTKEQVPLTCTLGVAAWRPGESAAALIERADQALYRGKDAGRDRVVLDGAPGSEITTPPAG